jgi:pimeloyl-ACP methyl ester carboxylesterase
MVKLALSRVRYRISGSGPATIVFVADPPNVIEHYDRLVELLAPFCRVVCLDMPGFGFSYPRRQFSYSIDDQVRVITELLDHLGCGPCYLAFSCGAAFAAVGISAQRPDLVAGVINIQAASWDEQVRWARRVDLMGLVGTPVLGQVLLAAAPQWVARKWYQAALPDANEAAAFAQVGSEAMRHGACFCLASGLQQLRSGAPALRPVALPAMVLWGSADRTHRRTDKSSSRTYYPEARWHEFPSAGHFPELEAPERFAGLLREFMAGR